MTESSLKLTPLKSKLKINPTIFIRRLVWKIAIATLFLMAVGSATRVMNAGLACPDWPLCYGQLVPTQQMNLQVFLEWFHRFDASLIGFSTILLASLSWWWRKDLPNWLPWTSIVAFLLIVFQGVLGGLTVTQMLRFDIVTAHLGTALLFFGVLIAIATALLPNQFPQITQPVAIAQTIKRLGRIAAVTTVLVYLQSLLGGLVASRWALHQCFNGYQLCNVMHGHLLGVVPPTVATLLLGWWTIRTPQIPPLFTKLATSVVSLVIVQIALGIATFKLHLQVEPLTITHQVIGASLLGVLVAFTILALRDTKVSTIRN
ncbi:MAG: heme A synthase [Cyanobacteria bacterium J06642_3]